MPDRIEHYEVIRSLGRGGTSEVLLARDTRLGRLVAIKLLREHRGDRVQRFLTEARATALVEHENIVVIHDLGEHEGVPYMVLEYIKGRTLREWLDEQKARHDPADTALPPARVEIATQIARALVCAHEHGIVHRDLKPSNVMLTDAGVIKVLDFGIATLLGQGDVASALGERGRDSLLGTKPYMSPEQWNEAPIDARTDVWSAGLILAELLLGQHPLAPLSMVKLASLGALDVPMPSLREARPELGKLATIVDRCLIKRREDRLGTARELLDELASIGAPRGPAAGEAESPYPGLSAFREGDAARFFGRARAISEAVTRLLDQPLLAVVGPSGVGKSSFVRAGLVPALQRSGEAWGAFVVRPGPRPLAALAELLAGLGGASPDAATLARAGEAAARDRDALAARLRAEPGLLGAELRARARRRLERVLLFVDQLEELYTLGPEDERAPFVACLAGVADDAGSPLRVVTAIRSDFLGRMNEAEAVATGLSRGLMLLSPLDREGLREALVRPLELTGYRFEPPGLVDEMLDVLEHTAGALPLLQFTAAMLWEQRARARRALTEESYRHIGGVAGTLARHADAVVGAMSAEERALARAALLGLVTPELTRAPAARRELCERSTSPAAMERVLARLVDARLLTAERRGDADAIVELVHESLIVSWPTLAQWIAGNREDAAFLARLREASRAWAAEGEAEGLLWRGQVADEARRWRAHGHDDLAPADARFLTAVLALADRAQRQRRRAVIGVVGLSLAIGVGMTSLALGERKANRNAEAKAAEARRNAAREQVEAVKARDAVLLMVAREQSDPTKAFSLLRELEGASPPKGWSALAKQVLDAGGVARVVLAHPNGVLSTAWSPDGRRIVTGLYDERLFVWSADGQGEPRVLTGHTSGVGAVAWSPDGKRIVSASYDGSARVFRADGEGAPIVLAGHTAPVVSIAWSPDGAHVVTASHDGTARVWSAEGGPPLLVLRHPARLGGAAWSPDGKRIATAGADKVARVWSADGTGAPLVLAGHTDVVESVAWSPDGTRVATASDDKTVRVWSADGTGAPLALTGHTDKVMSVAWSPDGTRIASGGFDGSVRVWNADGTGTPLAYIGHSLPAWSVAWSPDSRSVVSASGDGTTRVWSTDDRFAPIVLDGCHAIDCPAMLDPTSTRIVSTSSDTSLAVWNIDGTGAPRLLYKSPVFVRSAAWSPGGDRVAVGADNGVRVIRADGEGAPVVLSSDSLLVYVFSLAWSPDGTRIASGTLDGSARVWSADGTGKPIVLAGHGDSVLSVAWSPDGRRLATASKDKNVRVWNADGTGAPLVLTGHGAWIWAVAWSPDGRRLASGANDRTVRVWNADGAGAPLVLAGHTGRLNWVAWSPDGRRIASGAEDATVRVWNADGSGEPLVLTGHTKSVRSVAWTGDGTRIVSGSRDGTIRVWRNLDPVEPGDARVWAATNYCLPAAERVELLGTYEDLARQQEGLCRHRAREAMRPR
jgi:WD40 repeat protein